MTRFKFSYSNLIASNQALDRLVDEIEARYPNGVAMVRQWDVGSNVIDSSIVEKIMSGSFVACDLSNRELSSFLESMGNYFLWLEILILSAMPSSERISAIALTDNSVFFEESSIMRDAESQVELLLTDDSEIFIHVNDSEFNQEARQLVGELGQLLYVSEAGFQ